MQPEHQCQSSWELEVHAKARNFDFRLKAAIKHLPLEHNLARFSLRLKLSRVFIKSNGKLKAQTPSIKKLKFFKPKFCRILERFRIRRGTKRAIPATTNGGSVCQSPSTSRGLALLRQWISGFNEKGILVLSRMIFAYLASVFKNLVGRKMTIFLLVLIVSLNSCSIIHFLL